MTSTQSQKQQILELINDSDVQFKVDGPLNRMRQLYQHEVFHQVMHDFLNNQFDSHKWQHELRESFRRNWWRKIARERSQHFAGTEHGVNRTLTTAYLQSLQKEADDVQYQLYR